jgi:thioredoxin-like negative regulator of GroEL
LIGLYRASHLVPQDPGLRWQAARQHLVDGDIEQAKATLRPLAYDPHAGADNPATKLLALLEAGAGKDALAQLGPEGE